MKRRPREKYLDKGVRGWLFHVARKNYWRVASYYDLDDLIQDGYICFLITKQRYGATVKNKSHFMALFKRVYMSHILRLAANRTREEKNGCLQVPISQLTGDKYQAIVSYYGETALLEHLMGGIESDSEMLMTLERAPKEVIALLDALVAGKFNRPRQCRRLNGQYAKCERGTVRELNSNFFNRILGTNGIDYEAIFRETFAL